MDFFSFFFLKKKLIFKTNTFCIVQAKNLKLKSWGRSDFLFRAKNQLFQFGVLVSVYFSFAQINRQKSIIVYLSDLIFPMASSFRGFTQQGIRITERLTAALWFWGSDFLMPFAACYSSVREVIKKQGRATSKMGWWCLRERTGFFETREWEGISCNAGGKEDKGMGKPQLINLHDLLVAFWGGLFFFFFQ